MKPLKRPTADTQPNLGLYLDRNPLSVDARAMSDCLNVRIKHGVVTNANTGWVKWLDFDFGAPVTLLDLYRDRTGATELMIGTTRDLLIYNEGVPLFITPRYETGTISVTNGSDQVVGVSTLWNGIVKAGDQLYVGAAGQRDPEAAWVTVESVEDDTHLTLSANYTGSTAIGQDYTIRLLFQGSLDQGWDSATFLDAGSSGEDRWYATNWFDWVVRWNGSATQVTQLDALAFRCKTLCVFKNMMIYGRLYDTSTSEHKPLSIRNSVPGDPEDVSNAGAAENRVLWGPNEITAVRPMTDLLTIHSKYELVTGQYVGEPLIWVFRTAANDIGAVGRHAVANFGDYLEFIGPDTQYRFDGARATEINGHVWREIMRQHSTNRETMLRATFDDEQGDLLWSIPLTSDADTGSSGPPETVLVEHYLERPYTINRNGTLSQAPSPFTLRELPALSFGNYPRVTNITFADLSGAGFSSQNYPFNSAQFSQAFPVPLFGAEDGYIYQYNSGATKDGASMASFARFGRRAAVDGQYKGLIARIYAYAKKQPGAAYTLTVRLRTTDHGHGEITVKDTSEYDLTHAGNDFVSPFKVARFFEIEFGSDGAGEVWELSGYDVEVRVAGKR